MAIQSVDKDLCNGCRNCFEDCPMDVFKIDEETGKAYVAYPKDCMVCYICQDECTESAIILTHEPTEKICLPFTKGSSKLRVAPKKF